MQQAGGTADPAVRHRFPRLPATTVSYGGPIIGSRCRWADVAIAGDALLGEGGEAMKYHKILLAYNGSKDGDLALLECGELADFLQAETHLLAVATMPPSLFLTEGFVPEELL